MNIILDCFDKNFKRIGKISNYSFLQFHRSLLENKKGYCILTINKYNSELLDELKYILIQSDLLVQITNIKSSYGDKKELRIDFTSIDKLMASRVVESKDEFSGKLEDVVERMLNENFIAPTDNKRKIEKLVYDKKATGLNCEPISLYGSNVEEALKEILAKHNYGFKIVPEIIPYSNGTNIGRLKFELIPKVISSFIIFSKEFNNIKESSYEFDASSNKTTAIIISEDKTNGNKRVVINDELSGFERIEILEKSSISRQDDSGELITEQKFIEMLKARGEEVLNDNKTYEEFETTIALNKPFEYGKDYDLGYFATIVDPNTNKRLIAQFVDFTITKDSKGLRVDPTLGEVKPTNIALLKKKMQRR